MRRRAFLGLFAAFPFIGRFLPKPEWPHVGAEPIDLSGVPLPCEEMWKRMVDLDAVSTYLNIRPEQIIEIHGRYDESVDRVTVYHRAG